MDNKEQKKIRNQLARAWLNAHPLIYVSKLCREIDYNRGAFNRFESGHLDLGEDAIARLEQALVPYGYQPPICV